MLTSSSSSSSDTSDPMSNCRVSSASARRAKQKVFGAAKPAQASNSLASGELGWPSLASSNPSSSTSSLRPYP
ncbi:hypothetical protein CC85DRAFT_287661 [Cutaneotrichosporon oleaginosum]|uniref:Uncharacterized protein n=1 Tax=Cutaneotrichosporon oleaginosum TaxID=879819 RepID=A0A0J1AY43_9TREE|nr:uncharacterized protein CC85DRAFT_287661 [Cutaneotrichosporon oleaginosum]KLT40249.1 hypothetical protein CC85DRAFT_287661 [Cutaneotrichosporon oleaginosum]TXT11301.1 hypothetical protein COLE_01711 [Cutaneotrichosporon oleaginosum]